MPKETSQGVATQARATHDIKERKRMITTQRAQEFNIPPQGSDESDTVFRERVAGALREQGHFIEAHEALRNCLFDDAEGGSGVMQGVMGATAQTMRGKTYSRDGASQVGDDIAVGGIVREPKRPEMRLRDRQKEGKEK